MLELYRAHVMITSSVLCETARILISGISSSDSGDEAMMFLLPHMQ